MTIDGTYKSGYGSILEIVTEENRVTGRYETKFGRAIVTGSVGSRENYTAISFSAFWPGSDQHHETVTTYSGQYQILHNGAVEQINVVFLLATSGQFDENYQMNNVGYDIFKKVS